LPKHGKFIWANLGENQTKLQKNQFSKQIGSLRALSLIQYSRVLNVIEVIDKEPTAKQKLGKHDKSK
jgi:hypothetical protein